jgi:osmotically-inducible protein OsmY
MLRAMVRAFFKGIKLLFLLAIAAVIYSYYRTGRLPYIQESVEDAAVTASVKASMALHRDLAQRAIRVEARSGNVILRGSVGAEEEKRQATTIAQNVPGVRSVENLLDVTVAPSYRAASRTLGETLDDATVLAKIRAVLSLDRQTKPLDIEVIVRDGVVTLEGTLPAVELRARVIERVESVAGVEKIVDRLETN